MCRSLSRFSRSREDDADILAVNAASLAIATSNIPWNGPVSAVRLGLEEGKTDFLVNPTYKERDEAGDPKAVLDLTACGKDGLINMIEVGAKEVTEEVLAKALAKASEEIEKVQAWQKTIIAKQGKERRRLSRRSKTTRALRRSLRNSSRQNLLQRREI